MTLRIAHLSDIHFGGEQPEAVEAAIGAVEALAPSLTIVTGDLTLNGRTREFKAAASWLARLPAPVIVTPGNHDTPYWNPILRAIDPFGRYRRFVGPADSAAFDMPGLSVRCVNSARGVQLRPNWSKGALSMQALRVLRWPAEPSLRLFACHHPLVDLDGAPVTGGVRGGLDAARVLESEGIELVLSGHVHNPFAVRLGVGPPACYAVGAGTLSLRTRGTPASFSSLTIGEAEIDVTVQSWTGDEFKPGPSRRLQRART